MKIAKMTSDSMSRIYIENGLYFMYSVHFSNLEVLSFYAFKPLTFPEISI